MDIMIECKFGMKWKYYYVVVGVVVLVGFVFYFIFRDIFFFMNVEKDWLIIVIVIWGEFSDYIWVIG